MRARLLAGQRASPLSIQLAEVSLAGSVASFSEYCERASERRERAYPASDGFVKPSSLTPRPPGDERSEALRCFHDF